MSGYIMNNATMDEVMELDDMDLMDSVFEVECEKCGESHSLEPVGDCICSCGNRIESPLRRLGVV